MVRHSFSSVHSLETVQANVEGQHGGPTGMANIDAKQANTAYEFHENCHSVTFYVMKKDSKRCCDTTRPESIHTKDESKRGSAFAFIFGVN